MVDVDHVGSLSCLLVDLWFVMRVASCLPGTLAPRHLGGQRVESLRPEAAERLEPGLDTVERVALHPVPTPGALGPNRDEAVFAQHPEVLRHGWLADAELCLDDVDDSTRVVLAACEELEDATTHRITEDVERVHAGSISV
jgi:hypothetical protein